MARRGHGEGPVFQRASDGRWCAQLSLAGGKRKAYFGKTRAEVARKLAEALRDRDKGLPIVGERQTVGRYLAEWLEVRAQRLGVGSLSRYEQIVRLHLAPALGRTVLSRLTPQQVQRYYAAKLAEGYSATTVRYTHAMLKSALADAHKLGLVQRNICDLVDAPRAERAEMHPLAPEQVTAYLQALEGDNLYALFVLAIHTGMRQGELLALTWRDVDLEWATLQVHGTLHQSRGVRRVKEPKTKAGRRRIALSHIAVAALRAHRTAQLAERLRRGPAWRESDFIFTTSDGEIASKTMLTRRSKQALRRAELPDIRFHDLRHTAATLLLENGVNSKVVSEMLGHADIATTLRVYAHVQPHMQQTAAATVDRLFK